MRPGRGRSWWALAALGTGATAWAAERFPPPDFTSGHQLPVTTVPPARAAWLTGLDVGLLVLALAAASYLVLRRRSRTGLAWLALGSLLYFGFFRRGCICAIGALQNVALALADPTYAIPLSALVFFVLPLLVALACGRSFCAAVCPHGALQDLVLLRPVKVPTGLEHILRVLPFAYLAAALLPALAGSTFLICRYDPFVGIFRLSGSLSMILLGAGLLVLGVFIGRPYCRFLCPYGALLGLASRVSRWHATVTPDKCTRCRLCEDACPFNAIRYPYTPPPDEDRTPARRLLLLALALLPVLAACGLLVGARASEQLLRFDARAALAERLWQEEAGHWVFRDGEWRSPDGTVHPASNPSVAFRNRGDRPAELFTEVFGLRQRYRRAGAVVGLLLGLLVGARLVQYALRRTRRDYEPDREHCVSCGRCFLSCPYELQRRGLPLPDGLPGVRGRPAVECGASAPLSDHNPGPPQS